MAEQARIATTQCGIHETIVEIRPPLSGSETCTLMASVPQHVFVGIETTSSTFSSDVTRVQIRETAIREHAHNMARVLGQVSAFGVKVNTNCNHPYQRDGAYGNEVDSIRDQPDARIGDTSNNDVEDSASIGVLCTHESSTTRIPRPRDYWRHLAALSCLGSWGSSR